MSGKFRIDIKGGSGAIFMGDNTHVNLGTGNNINDITSRPSNTRPSNTRPDPVQETVQADSGGYGISKYTIKKGFALIINNEYFKNRPSRTPFMMDLKDLKSFCLLSNLAMNETDRPTDDLTAQEIEELCSEISKRDFSEYDALVCFIMSHGNESGILGTDDKVVSIDKIVTMFKNSTSLVNKPKLFFIQACRGKNSDSGLEADGPDDSEDCPPLRLPTASDTLIAYSCVEGYESYGVPRHGTLFMQALTDELERYAHRDHLMNILVRVNHKVASFDGVEGRKQMPCQMSTLTKFVYFNCPPPLDISST